MMKLVALALALATVPGAIAFGAYISAGVLLVACVTLFRARYLPAVLALVLAPAALIYEYQQRITLLSQRYERHGARALGGQRQAGGRPSQDWISGPARRQLNDLPIIFTPRYPVTTSWSGEASFNATL